MKMMELIANPRVIFTTKKIWRLRGHKYARKLILNWRCHGDLQKSIISMISVIWYRIAIKQSTSGNFWVGLVNICVIERCWSVLTKGKLLLYAKLIIRARFSLFSRVSKILFSFLRIKNLKKYEKTCIYKNIPALV